MGRRGSELSGISDNNVDEQEDPQHDEIVEHSNKYKLYLENNQLVQPSEPKEWAGKARPIDQFDITKQKRQDQGKAKEFLSVNTKPIAGIA